MSKLSEIERRLGALESRQAKVDDRPCWVAYFADDDAPYVRMDNDVIERLPGETNADIFARIVPNPRGGTFYAVDNVKKNNNES